MDNTGESKGVTLYRSRAALSSSLNQTVFPKTASPKTALNHQGFPAQRQRISIIREGPGLSLGSFHEITDENPCVCVCFVTYKIYLIP